MAVDTIINQKEFYDKGDPVFCIYVAVGQKTLQLLAKTLEDVSLAYTVIVSKYLIRLSYKFYVHFQRLQLESILEIQVDQFLIVFDDLSKQALRIERCLYYLEDHQEERAYPGDVFYLHSRLLERAAKVINDDTISFLK